MNGTNGMKTKKIGKMNELAWVIGIVVCSLGVCLCKKSDFGLSMIAAPPFILHVALKDIFPWFTHGTAEYVWQGFLLILMCAAVQRFRWRYLLSFGTAVLAGLSIDFWSLLLGGDAPFESLALRIAVFVFGAVLTALAIAFVFRTSLPIQIYELLVREIASRFHLSVDRVKMVNDIVMFVLSAALSWILTGGWNGFGIGTVLITLINAPLIALFGKLIDRCFTFDSRFPKLCALLEQFPEEAQAAEGRAENTQE
ncbi:MAG: hypothetical protein IKQ92_09010 [Clostridia bacterium]|nr:hypothetical protein [Clostridia bacterium]